MTHGNEKNWGNCTTRTKMMGLKLSKAVLVIYGLGWIKMNLILKEIMYLLYQKISEDKYVFKGFTILNLTIFN